MKKKLRRIIINEKDISQASIDAAGEQYKHLSEGETTELATNIGISIFMRELESHITEGETVLVKFIFDSDNGDNSGDISDTGWFEVIQKNNQMMFDSKSLFSAIELDYRSLNIKDIENIILLCKTMARMMRRIWRIRSTIAIFLVHNDGLRPC